MDEQSTQSSGRTAEEIAWDEEFKEDRQPNLASDLNNLARFAVKLPGELVASLVPEETARHARAAVRESFLALRTLLGAIGDNIEDMLAEPGSASDAPTVKGPPGTWGTGRPTPTTRRTSQTKRIEVEETE